MIKGGLFGKLLKQFFIISLISCFILLGNSFASAGKLQVIGLESSNSIYDNNFEITFLKGGGLLSNLLGQGKAVLALKDNVFFWWTTNGQPYYYDRGFQGFFGQYRTCDELTSESTGPSNCSSHVITGDYQLLFKGFFQKVKAGDYAFYDYEARDIGSSYYDNTIQVCWSSSEYGRSLCFRQHACYNGRGCSAYNYGSLVNSQGLSNLTFGLVANSWLGYAPGQNGYGGDYYGSSEGSSQGVIDSTITGDYVYADCTWNDILIALESEGYNKYVCYGGLDNFDLYDSSVNYNPMAGYGLSIADIWAWSGSRAWDSFPEWFTFWNGLYKDSSDNNYNAMWESYPAVYRTYFQIYNAYKGSVLNPRTVLEYCQLRTLTGSQLNNTAGGYFKPVCETIIREKQTGIWDSRLDGTIYSGGTYTGDVPIGVNWKGVGNMSGLETQGDGLVFIQNFFNLAKSKITTNFSDNFTGVLPGYIIVFLLAIILFRFLSH